MGESAFLGVRIWVRAFKELRKTALFRDFFKDIGNL